MTFDDTLYDFNKPLFDIPLTFDDTIYNFNKPLFDIQTTFDDTIYDFNKPLEDIPVTFDDTLYDFNKHMVGEIINTSDRGSITTNPETFYALDYFITPVDEYGEPTDRAGSYTDIYDFRIIRF